jgi:hypothetical protein
LKGQSKKKVPGRNTTQKESPGITKDRDASLHILFCFELERSLKIEFRYKIGRHHKFWYTQGYSNDFSASSLSLAEISNKSFLGNALIKT